MPATGLVVLSRAIAALSLALGGCSGGQRALEGTLAPGGDEDGDEDEATLDESSQDDEASPEPEACASISETAVVVRRPVDILFVIDNSTTMEDEIASIQQRIDQDFARIIEESGVDYRVIMVSLYGDTDEDIGAHPVCVSTPLSGVACSGSGAPLVQGERFFHYNTVVGSYDGACLLLDGFAAPDQSRGGYDPVTGDPWQSLAPSGYRQWLREDAFKSIVMVGDDNLFCSTEDSPEEVFADVHTEDAVADSRTVLHAADLDARLRALSTGHFGTDEERKYRIHTIVGLDADRALTPEEPLVDRKCPTAASDSWGYQELSVLTGGLRYPVCRHDSYDEIFHALADDAIGGSRLSCDWALPVPDGDFPLDPRLVNLEYAPGGGARARVPQVPSASACASAPGGHGWYYDDPRKPTRMLSCPALCSTLQDDLSGSVNIAFGCDTLIID
jgi:hypothetical protein